MSSICRPTSWKWYYSLFKKLKTNIEWPNSWRWKIKKKKNNQQPKIPQKFLQIPTQTQKAIYGRRNSGKAELQNVVLKVIYFCFMREAHSQGKLIRETFPLVQFGLYRTARGVRKLSSQTLSTSLSFSRANQTCWIFWSHITPIPMLSCRMEIRRTF